MVAINLSFNNFADVDMMSILIHRKEHGLFLDHL